MSSNNNNYSHAEGRGSEDIVSKANSLLKRGAVSVVTHSQSARLKITAAGKLIP
jgi:hypothetical protein